MRPYRFTPGVDGDDRDGRQVILLDLRLGDQQPFAMERIRPPNWANDTTGTWWRRYAEQPLWLTLGCYREGYELWTVPLRVEVDGLGRAVGFPDLDDSHMTCAHELQSPGPGAESTGLPLEIGAASSGIRAHR